MGAQIYYAEGLEKLATNIEETRPTIMVVVPRLFEVLRTRIMKQIAKQGGAASYLMDRALEIEERADKNGKKDGAFVVTHDDGRAYVGRFQEGASKEDCEAAKTELEGAGGVCSMK